MRAPRPLRRTRAGVTLLTVKQVCLLRALRDFPHDTAPSHAAWMRAAARQVRLVEPGHDGTLAAASRRLGAELVTRRRRRQLEAALTDLGRDLLDGRAPMKVIGIGAWCGFDDLVREAAMLRRLRTPAEQGRHYVRGDLWGGPLDGTRILAALPPLSELRFATTRADGSTAVAHYCLWDGLGAPWVTVPGARGEPLDDATRAGVFAKLEGKRGMRYRYVGMG